MNLSRIRAPDLLSRVGELTVDSVTSLENGRASALRAPFAWTWGKLASPVRSIELPPRTFVVGVGGATLGGSGKTPVAMAIARLLGEHFGPGVYVSHSADAARDETTLAMQKVAPSRVLCGDSWQTRLRNARRVLDEGSAALPWIVIDGLLQTAPTRLSLSVLALDAAGPFGSGRFPPQGDLRYAQRALARAADVLCYVQDRQASAHGEAHTGPELNQHPTETLFRELTPTLDRTGVSWERIPARVGLITHLARPSRVLDALRARGIIPLVHHRGLDHGRLLGFTRPVWGTEDPAVEGWLCTEKCSFSVDRDRYRPLYVLEESLSFSGEVVLRTAEKWLRDAKGVESGDCIR